jgi:hypothetical protein
MSPTTGADPRNVNMPRRQKPLGFEKWTWDEINQGRKMSKTEKRYRNMAVNLGATKSSDGRIVPPSGADNPTYYLVFGGLLLLCFVIAILSAFSSK